jgi:hypothetical protein
VVITEDVGYKDDASWSWSLPDGAGASDAMAWKLTQPDYLGCKDTAVITATGTPQWVSVSTAALTAAASSIDVTLPAGVAVGEVLLAFVDTANLVASGQATPSVPSGWSSAVLLGFNGTVAALSSRCLYRAVDGTEGASQTFSFSASAGQACAEVHRMVGVSTSTTVDASASATLAATALTPDPVSPTVTTTVANTMVFAHLNHYHAALTNSHTAPASNTERTDFESTVTAVITSATTDTRVFGSAGSTGTATHDCSETVATDAVMLRVALRPGTFTINL